MATPPTFANIAGMPENQRIRLIGKAAVEMRQRVGFVVEDDKKADRYIKKLQEQFPTIVILSRGPLVAKNLIAVTVGPPVASAN